LSQPQTTAAGCWWSAASWPQSAHGAPHVMQKTCHAKWLIFVQNGGKTSTQKR
jgi:hypothetical protein